LRANSQQALRRALQILIQLHPSGESSQGLFIWMHIVPILLNYISKKIIILI
jgi:hypothetical protein